MTNDTKEKYFIRTTLNFVCNPGNGKLERLNVALTFLLGYKKNNELFRTKILVGMEVKPCNGEKPLTEAATGRELDCGHGPFRQDCPVGSYCHQTTRFARCCRKGSHRNNKRLLL